MIVSELIEYLKVIDQDRVVVLSVDAEGNNYRLLEKGAIDGHNCAFLQARSQVGLERLTESLEGRGYSDENVLSNGVPAVVFY